MYTFNNTQTGPLAKLNEFSTTLNTPQQTCKLLTQLSHVFTWPNLSFLEGFHSNIDNKSLKVLIFLTSPLVKLNVFGTTLNTPQQSCKLLTQLSHVLTSPNVSYL